MRIFYSPFGGGGGAPSPPKLKQVKIPEAANLFTQYQKRAYDWSDTDWATRVPSLVAARDASINQGISALGGEVPEQTKGVLSTSGLDTEAAGLSGGDQYKTAKEEGQAILPAVQRNRTYFEDLMNNPAYNTQKRDLGLSGADVVRIAVGNTGNVNAFREAAYGTQLNNYASQQAQGAQNFGALMNLVTGLVSDFSKFRSQPTPYTDPYNSVYTPTLPYVPGVGYTGDTSDIPASTGSNWFGAG